VSAHALIECDCGQTMDADAHHTTCPNCGTNHKDIVREVVGRHLSEEEVIHPWHPDYEAWLRFKQTHTEYESWLEENPRQ
jgi:anaerobic ribonucleoside-triphosphate reductase